MLQRMNEPHFGEHNPPPFPRFQKPKLPFSPKLFLILPVIFFVVVGIFSSFYTVDSEEAAVVQRFGKYSHTALPGLHFKMPFGIDTVTKLPVGRQLKLEFGYNTPNSTNAYQRSTESDLERDMVTGDLNAANVEWLVQYGISDPRDYIFKIQDPGSNLRDITESVMCEVIGDRTVDEVLTIGRSEIESDCLALLKKKIETLKIGVRIDQIQLKNVHPPAPVQYSFDEVNRAQQEREQLINVANGEYNKIIPRLRGEAEQRISAAEGYATKRINEAEGDVARFRELLVQYEKAPAITKQRLYLETMNEVIPKLGNKIILDEDAKQFLPFMNLTTPSKDR